MNGSLDTWDLYVAFRMFSWCFFLLDELPDKGRSELQTLWIISVVFEPLQLFPWVSQRCVIVTCPTHLMGSAAEGGVCAPVTRCGSLPSPEQTWQSFLCCLLCLPGLWGSAQQGAVQQQRGWGCSGSSEQNLWAGDIQGHRGHSPVSQVRWPFTGVWWALWEFARRTWCGLTG